MGALISLFLDTRVKKADGFYPLKLRVTYNRERKYFGIDASRINSLLIGNLEQYFYSGREHYSMEEETFDKVMMTKPRGSYKELQDVFKEFELKYQKDADKLNPFSFEAFADLFNNTKRGAKSNDVLKFILNKKLKIESENKFNTATSYQSTLESIKNFSGKIKLPFEMVTPSFLEKYKAWMQSEKKSDTTTGIYLRTLRVIFNDAISEGITANYPFYTKANSKGVKIPKGKGRKLALTTDELKSIFNYEYPPKYAGGFYVDSWKLMYLMQGINPKDLCLLTYSDIKNGTIIFKRAKTSESAGTEIEIIINDKIQNLIQLWGNENKPENYIWPVFNSNEPKKQTKQVAQFVKLVNKYINRLAIELKINKDVTCYVARHSYATQLMKHGASTSFIGKSIGHTSTNTTDLYLGSFDEEIKREWQKKISEF
jgi:integrase/recombinase XerD